MAESLVVGLGPVPTDVVQPILGGHAEFVDNPTDEHLSRAVGAIVRADVDVDVAVFDSMPQLKVLARTGVGVDRVDVEQATARGIPVVITPGSNTQAVAEGTMAHLLAVTKNLAVMTELVRQGRWSERSAHTIGDLDGGVLALLGFGRIGRRVADLAQAFGMTVVAYDPYADISEVSSAATPEEAVSAASHVSLHLPSTPETAGLVNRELIGSMSPGTVMVNLARGDVLDVDAALWGLGEGILAGVGLDVFPEEPAVHHPLLDHPRVVLTPHVMGLSTRSARATFEMAAQGIVDVLTGNPPAALANPTV